MINTVPTIWDCPEFFRTSGHPSWHNRNHQITGLLIRKYWTGRGCNSFTDKHFIKYIANSCWRSQKPQLHSSLCWASGFENRKWHAYQRYRKIPHWRLTHLFSRSVYQTSSCTCTAPQFYLAGLLFWGVFFCDAPPRAFKCLKLLSFEKDTPNNPDWLPGSWGAEWSTFL